MDTPPQPPQPPTTPPPPPVAGVRPCRQCGYDIKGLSPEGVCPECGFSIEISLGSDELKNSSPEYIASLHKGVVIILTAIIVMFVLIFAGVGLAFATGAATGAVPRWLDMVTEGAGVLVSLSLVYGWWLFSAPDPAYSGRVDGSQARKVVRAALCVSVVVSLLNFVLVFLPPSQLAGVAMISLLVLSMVVFAVRYFAEMLYLKWLTPRIPDWNAYKRAKLLIWLGPVIYIVGAFCLMIGPLIALVLYWNLLDNIRKDLKAIRQAVPDMRG